ncbi:TPA: hypothetical protein DDW35_08165 [Candidatus Sumerlaeota bacterium]|jgi:hypothetical protein|nr:hypothetical protein [Candidatus Sumerlaeota bacterium]
MDWKLFAQLLVTLIVALIVTPLGWWVVHYFSSRRDLRNEQRKMVVEYLLGAYHKLEENIHPSSDGESKQKQLESAIAEIQLLGSQLQIKMALEFAASMANTGEGDLQKLLFDLRASLRFELQLEDVNAKILYYRIHAPNETTPNKTLKP